MTSTAAPTTVTTVAVATPVPAPTTLGSTIDQELAVVKARLAVLESDASTDWSKVKAWLGTNWPHFVTWAGGALLVVDKLGVKLL